MLRRVVASALGGAAVSFGRIARAGRRPQRVLFFTRNVGYYHSVVQRKGDAFSLSERALVQLGKRINVDIVCSKDGRLFDGDLDPYDAFAFFTNNDLTVPNERNEPPMSMAGKQRMLDAIDAGKGFIGFHSSCASWRTPGEKFANSKQVDPFIAMLGGEFVAHGPQQQATIRVVSPNFPGVETLGDSFQWFEEWYALKNFAQDLHVILVQETRGMTGQCYQRPPFPSTWARRHGKGRVFFTSMAHRGNTWVEPPFTQLALGGLSWVVGNVDFDVPPNLDEVTPAAGQLGNVSAPGQ